MYTDEYQLIITFKFTQQFDGISLDALTNSKRKA